MNGSEKHCKYSHGSSERENGGTAMSKVRFVCIWLIVAVLVSGLLVLMPFMASADEIPPLNISDGNIIIDSDGYTVGNGSKISYTGDYVISGSTTSNTITVKGTDAKAISITIDGLSIKLSSNSKKCPITIESGSCNLTIEGTNTLTAGEEQPAIKVEEGQSLTIGTVGGGGELVAAGGRYAAGIGGSGDGFGYSGNTSGKITINSGTITATAGGEINTDSVNGGAGIGGGSCHSNGTVIINGGTVTATGSSANGGAGIGGGGDGGSGGTILITGGTVTAAGVVGNGYSGAGIGGGHKGEAGNITITGGTVEATGGENASGIGSGGGFSGKSATEAITIEGGKITATGGVYAPGIGTASQYNDVIINITDGEITARGSSAGIGGGNRGTVAISGGTIEAIGYRDDSDYEGPGIGTRHSGIGVTSGIDITIKDAKVTAIGGKDSAGIGGGIYTYSGNITIESGEITAIGGNGGAGIGAGTERTVNSISITGGTLDVIGGEKAAGIGCGYEANVQPSNSDGTVTITGGTITVHAGSSAGTSIPPKDIGSGGDPNSCKLQPAITGGTINGKKYHAITVNDRAGGKISAGGAGAGTGDTVTLTATPDTGYALETVTVTTGGSPVTVTDNSFTMPDADVTVTATWIIADYTVTVDNVTGGTVTASQSTANYSDTITLTVTPESEDYTIDKITVVPSRGSSFTVTNNEFSMPDADVTIKPTWKHTHTITVNNVKGGTVTVDVSKAFRDDTVTFTATPESDEYIFEKVTVTASDGTNITVKNNTFTMPDMDVTVTPKWSVEVLENGVYQIATVEQLLAFAERVNEKGTTNAKAILLADLDLSGIDWYPIGQYSDTSFAGYTEKAYTSTFDGNGHIISNLSVTLDTPLYGGLFGKIDSNGKVNNLGIVNASITSGAGAPVGVMAGAGKGVWFENCYTAGNISLLTSSGQCGGFVGKVDIYTYIGRSYTTYDVLASNPELLYLMGETYSGNDLKTSEMARSGELCLRLNGNESGGDLWRQTIGTDPYPTFSKDSGKVYVSYVLGSPFAFHNTASSAKEYNNLKNVTLSNKQSANKPLALSVDALSADGSSYPSTGVSYNWYKVEQFLAVPTEIAAEDDSYYTGITFADNGDGTYAVTARNDTASAGGYGCFILTYEIPESGGRIGFDLSFDNLDELNDMFMDGMLQCRLTSSDGTAFYGDRMIDFHHLQFGEEESSFVFSGLEAGSYRLRMEFYNMWNHSYPGEDIKLTLSTYMPSSVPTTANLSSDGKTLTVTETEAGNYEYLVKAAYNGTNWGVFKTVKVSYTYTEATDAPDTPDTSGGTGGSSSGSSGGSGSPGNSSVATNNKGVTATGNLSYKFTALPVTPIINVTIPSSITAVINPYGIPVTTKNGNYGADGITSSVYTIRNKTETSPISVNTKLYLTVPKDKTTGGSSIKVFANPNDDFVNITLHNFLKKFVGLSMMHYKLF